jgi:hypothetical protein
MFGLHKYHYRAAGYNARPAITYEHLQIVSFLTAKEFITFVNDDATTNLASKPPIRFTGNCRSSRTDLGFDYRENIDCTLNWKTALNCVVQERTVSMRAIDGNLPKSGGTTVVHLPPDSLITRVRCFKAAGGTDTATSRAYTLKDADNTTIATTSSGGSAWNAAWSYDTAQQYQVTTDNKRKLTLTAPAINEAADFFLVSYLA